VQQAGASPPRFPVNETKLQNSEFGGTRANQEDYTFGETWSAAGLVFVP
jgi:hypothetical protein